MTLQFIRLSHSSPSPAHIEAAMEQLQRFIISMYGIKDGKITEVNQPRYYLAQKGKEFGSMPPTPASLESSLYVAGFVWGNSLVKAPQLPFFELDYAFVKLAFR